MVLKKFNEHLLKLLGNDFDENLAWETQYLKGVNCITYYYGLCNTLDLFYDSDENITMARLTGDRYSAMHDEINPVYIDPSDSFLFDIAYDFAFFSHYREDL